LKAVSDYATKRTITLQDAVAIALYTSREFARSVAQLQQAIGRAGQARAALMPTLGVSGNITEFDSATVASLGAFTGGSGSGTGSSAAPSLLVTPQFNPVLTAALSMPLDVAGPLRAAASQADFLEVAARIDVNRVRNQVVYNVKTAFYNVLRAQAQVAVAAQALNNTLTRLGDANKNFAAGTVARFDVITAQRDVADAQQGVINARAQRSVNLAALKNTIGLSLDTHLAISDSGSVEYPPGVARPPEMPAESLAPQNPNPVVPPVPNGPPIEVPGPRTAAPLNLGGPETEAMLQQPSTSEVEDNFDFGPEYRSLVSEALRTRPEILEGDAEIAAAKRGLQYARVSSLPQFSVSLSDVYTPNATALERANMGVANLAVTLPIFDGGLARERLREARGSMAGAEISRRQAVDTVQVDVQTAYITLVQARARVAVSDVEVAQAQESYRLAIVRYNAGVSQQPGVSPQLEFSNAQNALALAQSNHINALYDYNNARAQLDRAVGRYSFTGLAPGYKAVPPAAK
jgi:outer membrane protein TolC